MDNYKKYAIFHHSMLTQIPEKKEIQDAFNRIILKQKKKKYDLIMFS